VGRRLDQGAARTVLHDPAPVENQDPIGQVARGGEVVGDQDDGEPLVALQLGEQVQHPGADGHVEHRGWLVGHQQIRPDRQGAGDGDALALAAGELEGQPVDEVLRGQEAHGPEQLDGALADGGSGVGPEPLQGRLEVLGHGVDRVQGCERVLEDHLDAPPVGE
jgi:hypothetical protein